MANWNVQVPLPQGGFTPGVLSITQQGGLVVFSFNAGAHARFFQPTEVQGGIDNDLFWIYTITPRQAIPADKPFANEMEFTVIAPQTAIQVAQDFAALRLQAARVSIGLTPT